MNRRTCLVTGGAGFIGCAISAGLAQRFERVIAFDSLHPQIHLRAERPAALAPDVELHRADVCDAAAWDAVLGDARPDVVVHLAAETGTGQSLTESTRHAHVNVVGTATMLDAFSRCGMFPERVVLASSRAVYGEGAWRARATGAVTYPGSRSRQQLADGHWDFAGCVALPACAGETHPMPVSVYAATKLAQENMLRSWASAFNVALACLRLQNVYGPGQAPNNPYTGIVTLFCQIARDGGSIPLYEDGAMTRDFVAIDDVAAALLAAVEAPSAPGRTLDIGSGDPRPVAAVAERIAALCGAPPPHVCGRYRFGDVRHASCRIEAAAEVLGWRPRIDLDAGLGALLRWLETAPLREAA